MSTVIKLSEKNKDFFEMVFEVVRQIPSGRVTSYGAIASYLGAKRSSRMVGWAMNASHRKSDVPAHRVVNRLGILSGKLHFDDPNEMEKRLISEGILIDKDRVVDLNMVFWDPAKELTI